MLRLVKDTVYKVKDLTVYSTKFSITYDYLTECDKWIEVVNRANCQDYNQRRKSYYCESIYINNEKVDEANIEIVDYNFKEIIIKIKNG